MKSWEARVERLIREAQERGEFDDLPGAGNPIEGLDKPHDPYWWIKQLLEREGLSVTPPALALKKEIEKRLAGAPTERALRRVVTELNEKIAELNRTGSRSDIALLDADAVVARWQA